MRGVNYEVERFCLCINLKFQFHSLDEICCKFYIFICLCRFWYHIHKSEYLKKFYYICTLN